MNRRCARVIACFCVSQSFSKPAQVASETFALFSLGAEIIVKNGNQTYTDIVGENLTLRFDFNTSKENAVYRIVWKTSNGSVVFLNALFVNQNLTNIVIDTESRKAISWRVSIEENVLSSFRIIFEGTDNYNYSTIKWYGRFIGDKHTTKISGMKILLLGKF